MQKIFYSQKTEIPTIDGKILELNVETSKEFLKEWQLEELYDCAEHFFKKPLYFDAKGNKVKNPQNYEKISIKSVFLKDDVNISAMFRLLSIIREYENALDTNSKIVDLRHIHPDYSKMHVCITPEYQKYFNGVFKINCEPPFLSLKMN